MRYLENKNMGLLGKRGKLKSKSLQHCFKEAQGLIGRQFCLSSETPFLWSSSGYVSSEITVSSNTIKDSANYRVHSVIRYPLYDVHSTLCNVTKAVLLGADARAGCGLGAWWESGHNSVYE